MNKPACFLLVSTQRPGSYTETRTHWQSRISMSYSSNESSLICSERVPSNHAHADANADAITDPLVVNAHEKKNQKKCSNVV